MAQMADVGIDIRRASAVNLHSSSTQQASASGCSLSGDDALWAQRLETFHVYDSFNWETNEFELRASTFPSGFRLYPDSWPRVTGVPSNDEIYFCNFKVHYQYPGYIIEVPVVETDVGADDNYLVWDAATNNASGLWIVLENYTHNMYAWSLYRDGYIDDYPGSNRVRATFTWPSSPMPPTGLEF